jgi:hypothetical protein
MRRRRYGLTVAQRERLLEIDARFPRPKIYNDRVYPALAALRDANLITVRQAFTSYPTCNRCEITGTGRVLASAIRRNIKPRA